MSRPERTSRNNLRDHSELKVDDPAKRLIQRYVQRSAEILKDKLTGVYLHGSAAMGCYQPKKSDLDFLVVVSEMLTETEKRAYMDMVAGLDAEGPAKGIEMSIVSRDACNPFVYPTPFILHYSRGHAEWYRKNPEEYIRKMNGTDKDLAAHFTVIRNRGCCLYGLPIHEAFGEVPERDYLDSLLYDVAGAAEEIREHPMYMILNLARVLAFLREKKILSKKEGGTWGLRNLPEEYHPLVLSALHEYESGEGVRYDPDSSGDYAVYMLKQITSELQPHRQATADGPVRAALSDAKTVAALACELWPDHTPEEMTAEYSSLLTEEEAAVFLFREQGEPAGFAQCQLRHDYVEGTETSPVGYLEGIYVREPDRRRGIARELLEACEKWAGEQGCTEFASDCELTNTESQKFHQAVGFEEVNRIVAYVRKL